jgi:HD superfamily phosphohydrolase
MSENLEYHIRELYDIIKNLTERIKVLENEKEYPKGKSIRIDKLLRELSPPSVLFVDWVNNILNRVEYYLETVFNNDLLFAIKKLLSDSLSNNIENLPITVLDKKSNTFYYYNEEENWVLLENKDFDIKIMNRISYRFLFEFNRLWYKKNSQNIKDSDEYKDLYNDYYLKILGGNRMSDDSRNQKIRKHFYGILKEN